ncbi:MAG: hypothetical protein KC466_14600 [Myxococcales bacterium]|nr:hypothetical protein [Myxococcales bacterium]
MNNAGRSFVIVLNFAVLAAAVGCATQREQIVRDWRPGPSEVESGAVERLRIGRMALLPVFGVVGAESDSLGCDVCVRRHAGGPNSPQDRRWLEEQVYGLLPADTRADLVPRDLTHAAAEGRALLRDGPAPKLKDLVEVGKLLKADSVLAVFVFRFREREGTQYGIHAPASVAFELALIRVGRAEGDEGAGEATGATLWRASFDETQESLSENLLKLDRFIENRGQWVEAAVLARYGLRRVMKTFPEAGP